MSSNETWRQHPLEVGRAYLATRSFSGAPNSEFIVGTVYVLKSVDYSHYDSQTIFTFQQVGGNTNMQWWWHDNESDTHSFDWLSVAT